MIMKWDCTAHAGWGKNHCLLSNPHKHTTQHTDLSNCWLAFFQDTPTITWVRNSPAYCLFTLGPQSVREAGWHFFLKNLTDWFMDCVRAPVMWTKESGLAWSLCLKTNETFEVQTRAKVRRRWRASHLEDGTGAVVNGQDVCDVVSGQLFSVSCIWHKQDHTKDHGHVLSYTRTKSKWFKTKIHLDTPLKFPKYRSGRT